jgi:hypothetical protein
MVEHMTAATFDVIADVTFSDGSGHGSRRALPDALETLYRRRRADEHSRRPGRSRL